MPPKATTTTKPADPPPLPRPMPLAKRIEVCICRATNGWLIFDANTRNSASVSANPLMVAETPERLCEIIDQWARS